MCIYKTYWYYHDVPCARDGHYGNQFTHLCKYATRDPATGDVWPCASAVSDGGQIEWLLVDECRKGACRLQELGHRWRCCVCGTGSNKERNCRRREGDTYCYHTVCQTCRRDAR